MKHYWEDMESEFSLEGAYLQGFSYEDYPIIYDEPPAKTFDEKICGVAEEIEEHIQNALHQLYEAMSAQEELDDLMQSVNEARMSALQTIADMLEQERARYEPDYDGPTLEDLS